MFKNTCTEYLIPKAFGESMYTKTKSADPNRTARVRLFQQGFDCFSRGIYPTTSGKLQYCLIFSFPSVPGIFWEDNSKR